MARRQTKAQREASLWLGYGAAIERATQLRNMRFRPHWWQQQYDLNQQRIRWHEQQLGITA